MWYVNCDFGKFENMLGFLICNRKKNIYISVCWDKKICEECIEKKLIYEKYLFVNVDVYFIN